MVIQIYLLLMSLAYYEELTGADLEDDVTNRYNFEEGKSKAEVTEYELPESKKEGIFGKNLSTKGVYYYIIELLKRGF